MKLMEMYILKEMLEKIIRVTEEGSYHLSHAEKLALLHFNQAADMGEDYRLFLFQMALEVGIAPGHLLYLRRLAWLGITVIE